MTKKYRTLHYDISPECEEGKPVKRKNRENVLLYITYQETAPKAGKRKTRALYLDTKGKYFESETGKEGRLEASKEQEESIMNIISTISEEQETKAKANISIFLRLTEEMTKGKEKKEA